MQANQNNERSKEKKEGEKIVVPTQPIVKAQGYVQDNLNKH